MSTEFLGDSIWTEITRAIKDSKRRADAAVAFFGTGASKLLPLKPGSVLVVNASENVVKAGLTDPSELLRLQERGVRAYSVDNLHAKVFVLGRRAYIGSTNVSSRSANYYVESALRTTDLKAVQAARKFVERLCVNELGPGQLETLKKIYKPPRVAGRKATAGGHRRVAPGPRVFVTQLVRKNRTAEEEALVEKGAPVAARARKHPRTWISDKFDWPGKCLFTAGDKVVQVTNEKDGHRMVEEAATVLHVESGAVGRGRGAVVFVERPASRRRSLGSAAKFFGCTQAQLKTNGLARKRSIALLLLKSW